MGCTITGSLEGDAALAARESNEALSSELQKVTQLLCTACETLDNNHVAIPSDVREWWVGHSAIDKNRIKREQENNQRHIENLKRQRDLINDEIFELEEDGT